jgi:Family of unknown function (DUF5754)
MKTFVLRKSDKSDKKYMVIIAHENKTIHFGARGYA